VQVAARKESEMTVSETSPRLKARIAGAFYLLTIPTAVLSPPLEYYLFPYNLAPGLLGEGSLTLWLLVVGVNTAKWSELANARRVSRAQATAAWCS
jgi:hypothetical protein